MTPNAHDDALRQLGPMPRAYDVRIADTPMQSAISIGAKEIDASQESKLQRSWQGNCYYIQLEDIG